MKPDDHEYWTERKVREERAEIEQSVRDECPCSPAHECGFYLPRNDGSNFMDLTDCMEVCSTEPDEYGRFAVLFTDPDGNVYSAESDMENMHLFFGATLVMSAEAPEL